MHAELDDLDALGFRGDGKLVAGAQIGQKGVGTGAAVDAVARLQGVLVVEHISLEHIVACTAGQAVLASCQRNSALKISPQRINDLRAF